MSFASEPRDIQGFLTGGLTTSPSVNQVLAVMVVAVPGQIRTVAVSTNGVGNAAITVDLQINGVSAWTLPANRPTIAAGTPAYTVRFSRPNKRALRPGDIVNLVVISAANNVGVAATAILEYPDDQP